MRAASIRAPLGGAARRFLRHGAPIALFMACSPCGTLAEPAARSPAPPAVVAQTPDADRHPEAAPQAAPEPAKRAVKTTPVTEKADGKDKARGKSAGESVDDAICRLIEDAARQADIPVAFFTRLIWRESSFRTDVVSHAGAQGIAQFMPGTAKERGLVDPFDPASAIPASAHLLADLNRQFGNLGLAAAAYNAGPGRVRGFLAGGGLPSETRDYVAFITGESAQTWAGIQRQEKSAEERTPRPEAPAFPKATCLETVAGLRKGAPPPAGTLNELFAPWGVQISGNYSRAIALASFRRAAAKHPAVFSDLRPVIIATRVGGRGRRVFYRVRLPAQTRPEAMRLCDRLRKAGGACLVLPN